MDTAASQPSLTNLFLHKGIYFAIGISTPEAIDSLEHFKIRDNDLFLVTYPKSGTVWLQNILSLIYHEGHRKKTETIETVDRMPWLEYNLKGMDYEQRPSPRLFSTHLPYYLVPSELKNKKAKVIYVTRNPKDNMISYYFFHNFLSKANATSEKQLELDEFMEKYLTGKEVHSSSWFDHVNGWYSHKNEFNILFLSYEDMIKDLRTAVLKICSFVGKQLDDQTVDEIVEQATFKTMKNDSLANYESITEKINTKEQRGFLRKGTIGDWKNVLTVAQNEKFDNVMQEKLKELPIKFIWDINDIV